MQNNNNNIRSIYYILFIIPPIVENFQKLLLKLIFLKYLKLEIQQDPYF